MATIPTICPLDQDLHVLDLTISVFSSPSHQSVYALGVEYRKGSSRTDPSQNFVTPPSGI